MNSIFIQFYNSPCIAASRRERKKKSPYLSFIICTFSMLHDMIERRSGTELVISYYYALSVNLQGFPQILHLLSTKDETDKCYSSSLIQFNVRSFHEFCYTSLSCWQDEEVGVKCQSFSHFCALSKKELFFTSERLLASC